MISIVGVSISGAALFYLVIRILEKILIIYFSVYFILDFFLFLYSLFRFRRLKKTGAGTYDYGSHSISIIVPAYNEEISIVQCLKMLLEVDYPNFELIVVNDGSKDQTHEKMLSGFSFIPYETVDINILTTAEVKQCFISSDRRIIYIDKSNGGKADAINTGINYSTKKYICTIDADSILDAQALKKVIQSMIIDPHTFVSGGQLAAANGVVISHNKVLSSKMPGNPWVLWQIIEYIKSFMISRISLSRFNALLIMSGAFSIYKKEDLLDVGGFLTEHNNHPYLVSTIGYGNKTVCEDMEIVVRLWRYYRENKKKGKAKFIPQPVCWTEMPDNASNLYKQRSRWHLGLCETMLIHRAIIFEPKYGATGMIAMPYYLFFELLSPVVKLFTLFFLVITSVLGLINTGWVMLLLTSIILTTAIITSSITVFIESWSEKQTIVNRDALRYKTFSDWIWLLFLGIIGDFSFAFFRMYAQLIGILNFIRKKSEWNKFERRGVENISGS
jgi:poly-beta-1,6-N-acetyl-D-glucosamine synthase